MQRRLRPPIESLIAVRIIRLKSLSCITTGKFFCNGPINVERRNVNMKWVIYLLATVAFVFILRHFLPASNGVATTVGDFPIKWYMLCAGGFFLLATRVK